MTVLDEILTTTKPSEKTVADEAVEDLLRPSRVGEGANVLSQAPESGFEGIVKAGIEAFTGESRREEELPGLGVFADEFSFDERQKIGRPLFFDRDPQKAAAEFKKLRPDAKIDQDKFGNVVVEFKGQKAFVNAPGADLGDVARFAEDVLLFLPGARFGAGGKTMLRRMGRTALGEGSTEALLQQMREGEVDIGQALSTGAIGAVFEGLAPVAVATWRAIFGSPQFFKNGKLTEGGKQAAEEAGLDPDTMNERLAEIFAEEAVDSTDLGTAGRTAQAREFDIPLTRGQATQDIDQLEIEEMARKSSALGERARVDMREADRVQAERIVAARDRIQADFSGDERLAATEPQAGAVLAEGLRDKATRLDADIDAAYGEARTLNAAFTGDSLGDLTRNVREELTDFGIDPELHPAAVKSLQGLAKLSKEIRKRSKDEFLNPVELRRFETERRKLSQRINSAKNAADRAATIRIKRQLDSWLDDAFDDALFSGDQDALEVLKSARKLRTEKGRLFEAENPRDRAGKIVEKIVDSEASGEQVANWIIGSSQIGNNLTAIDVVKRLQQATGAVKGGPGPQEWNALRELVWMRLTREGHGSAKTAQATSKAIDMAFNKSPTLMRELFDGEELARMKRFGKVLGDTVTPRDVQNNSRTAFTLTALLRQLMRRGGTAATFSGNTVLGATLFTLARTPSFTKARRARKAGEGAPRGKATAPGFVAGGTVATKPEEE